MGKGGKRTERLARLALLVFVVACAALPGCGTTLVVNTNPAGAHVSDHRLGYFGISPLRREISSDDLVKTRDNRRGASTLLLTISQAGYKPAVVAKPISAHETVQVEVQLEPLSGSLER